MVGRAERYIAVNGSVIRETDAVRTTASANGADGVYESIFISRSTVIDMQAHVSRLYDSCAFLKLDLYFDISALEDIIAILVEKNALADSYAVATILVTRAGAMGLMASPEEASYSITISRADIGPELYANGRSLSLAHVPSYNPLAEHPTLSRLQNDMLYADARRTGFDDALVVLQGKVLECTRSNIFIYRDGAVRTPASGVLPGITRNHVVLIAGELGYEVLFDEIESDELLSASEVFTSDTVYGVVPVTRIGNTAFPAGELTKKLIERFHTLRSVSW